ncbi:MAG: alpha/beta fold hydrolase [Neisseria sp.]|uniref:alpha/beta fold hydrolase n=1 Tax=Neisseria sp. TaxID=192066 RepID=UPI0026DBF1A4|nr:alpha/beta hydrolase [Neisseria sp.]MDO4641890.1 alpha/beta fold hydrolase [Neisseria sp.]
MQSNYLNHLDAKLHYQTGGTANKPVLVLLHGGLGSIADFDAVLPQLQPQFRLIAIDTRGHGRSTLGSAKLTYQQFADDVLHILGHEGIEQFSLFGFGDGGICAYRIGAICGGVDKIITLGAHWHADNLSRIRPLYNQLDEHAIYTYMPEAVAFYRENNPRPNVALLTEHLKTMWLDNGDSGYPNNSVRSVKASILAMRGETDFLLGWEDMASLKSLVQAIHLANIPFAGHEAVKEQPEMVLAAIKAFWAF